MKVQKLLKKVVPVANAETKKKKKESDKEYTVVAETKPLEIGETSELHFSASMNEEGEIRIDVRTFIDTPRYTGATKKGINFGEEELTKVIKKLQEIKAKLTRVHEEDE